ncbi:hypothetical protein PIB30_027983 [Stylosanthes scabra]|uniref:Uncharacterized protein n=1 Tax=Stylosanthes scabra TaxID=79078 RepID=A0ABU6VCF3_9FABA|nr:hypothetical protein [Stylosanthes scabra]
MEGKDKVKADRRNKIGFFSTKRYWPKDSKKDIFHVDLTKDEKKGEKTFIKAHDLNILNQMYGTIKFQLELRYINLGMFYAIVWNEKFNEVIGRMNKNLYVRDMLPTWILDLISKEFKLCYLEEPEGANSGVTSPSKKTPQSHQKTPSTLKRNTPSTSASKSKRPHSSIKATHSRESELMTITKTLTSADVTTTRLYVRVEFTHTMAKAGLNNTWYVIGPPID